VGVGVLTQLAVLVAQAVGEREPGVDGIEGQPDHIGWLVPGHDLGVKHQAGEAGLESVSEGGNGGQFRSRILAAIDPTGDVVGLDGLAVIQ